MKTFLIIGPSRSGTSLTAGLLHHNGINMGRHAPTHPANPLGFYEDLDFVNFNAKWLCAAGGNFAHPPGYTALQRVAISLHADDFLRSTIAMKGPGEWGVKDPRIVWLWPWYQELFANLNPHLIITRRNALDIARSLVAAGWAEDLQHGARVAARFDRALTQIVKMNTWPLLELHFEQWCENRRRQEEQIETFVGRRMDFGSVRT